MAPLPPARPGTALRVLATTDLAGTLVPFRTSYGQGGSCAGVAGLLERERDRQPTVWLDAGDFTVGPTTPLLGERPWADMAALPIAAAAAGNHEFDDGVPALLEAARALPYPLLCANADVGLPASVLVDTGADPLGVIGLTHPHVHRLSQAPPPAGDWPERVGPLARELRANGARWVVAILHDGVDWWPNQDPGGPPTRSRSERLAAVAAPWAGQVDLILGGHVPDAFIGDLAGTPAGHAHMYAASVVVVDLPGQDGSRPLVRGWFPVPPVRPARRTAATDALDTAAANLVGHSRHTWLSRTGAERYLPDLVARALPVTTPSPTRRPARPTGCGGTGPACRPGSALGRGSRARSRSCPGSCPAWPSCWDATSRPRPPPPGRGKRSYEHSPRPEGHAMRAISLNLFGHNANWPARRQALQEAVVDGSGDQAAELLGPEYHLVHQARGLIGDGRHRGASVASRWPILEVHEVDLHLTPRTGDYSCGTVVAEVAAPASLGRLLVVSHGPSWAWWAEAERELQALAVVRRIEELVAGDPVHVVVGGDFNAAPDTASIRFWTGRQTLDGVSTAYRDCWESVNGNEPGLTFEPANPLSATDEPGLDRGRRIDYLLVRCGDHGPTLRIADCRRVFDEPVSGVWGSDHYGVLADLELPRRAPGSWA